MTLDPALLAQQVERQRRRRWLNRAVLFAGLVLLAWLVMDVAVRVLGVPPAWRLIVSLATAPLLAALVGAIVWGGVHGAGRVAHAVLHPPSGGVAAVPTSGAESLFVQGNVDASMAAFDALRQRHGPTAPLLRREAELHLGRTGRPERARELLIRLRQVPGVSAADELFATQRLIDLYFGVLGDDPRALTEMRRLVDRFPGTRDADGARAELERRRQR